MIMYSYTKKNSTKVKRRMLFVFSGCLFIMVGVMSYVYRPFEKDNTVPVIKNQDQLVIALPTQVEKAVYPYQVEASIALGYFDGSDTAIQNVTEFEGTFRGNQGSDYCFNQKEFPVFSIFSGEVIEVRDDALFGKTIKIKQDDIEICYQSLKDIEVKVGDKIKQNDVLGKASVNIYNKELGNHLHVVVEKNDLIINPESIYGKIGKDIK